MHPRSTRWQRDMIQLQDLLRALHSYPWRTDPKVVTTTHRPRTRSGRVVTETSNLNLVPSRFYPQHSIANTETEGSLALESDWGTSRIRTGTFCEVILRAVGLVDDFNLGDFGFRCTRSSSYPSRRHLSLLSTYQSTHRPNAPRAALPKAERSPRRTLSARCSPPRELDLDQRGKLGSEPVGLGCVVELVPS